MPPKLDLTGRRFGKLLVEELAGSVKYGSNQPAWRCLCDCGVRVVFPQRRLVSIRAGEKVEQCPACRSLACVVCGQSFIPTSSRVITCSIACRENNRSSKLIAAAKRRADIDPETKHQEQKRYRERLKNDPIKLKRKREYSAEWSKKNRKILESRRLERLTEEEYANVIEKRREYYRNYMASRRSAAKQNDPEAYERILEVTRRSRAKAMLDEMIAVGEALDSRMKK